LHGFLTRLFGTTAGKRKPESNILKTIIGWQVSTAGLGLELITMIDYSVLSALLTAMMAAAPESGCLRKPLSNNNFSRFSRLKSARQIGQMGDQG
jgi:hypothetical protein